MKSSELCREWVASLPTANSILKNIQQKGHKSFLKREIPTGHEEKWRLSNLKSLKKFVSLPIASQSYEELEGQFSFLKKVPSNILQIIVDPIKDTFTSLKLPDGITKLTNEELRNYLGKTLSLCECEEDWPVLINESSASTVIGLKITGKDLPILEMIFSATPNSLNSTRVILVIEENTHLELTQVIIGRQDSAQSNLIEISVGKNSEVNHGVIALGEEESNLLNTLAIKQDTHSKYSLISLQKGWKFSRLEPHVVQNFGGAETTLQGLQISNKLEQISTHSFVKFNGPDGQLNQLNKSAANGSSHSIFNGAIIVPRIAQKTEASQLSRNLLLSKRARIDTKPELQIIADDVRCTHGATVSQLQEDELFYLRSRGIGSNQANSLLLDGYYHEVLSNLPCYSERWFLLNNFLSDTK